MSLLTNLISLIHIYPFGLCENIFSLRFLGLLTFLDLSSPVLTIVILLKIGIIIGYDLSYILKTP